MAFVTTVSELTAQRTDIAVFMEVETGKYAQCGTAWTTFTENPNAQTKSRKFINEKTERNNITRYAPEWSFECLLMYERPDIRKIYDIVKERKTGSDTIVTFIVVDLFDGETTAKTARKVNASVQVSSFDDDDDMIIKGSFHNQGDEVLGTFNMTAGEFTPDSTPPATVSSIAMKTQPTKTTYSTGDELDVTGAVITATYSDSTTADVNVTAAMCSGFDSSTTGEKTVTVTYQTKTTTFTVTVS